MHDEELDDMEEALMEFKSENSEAVSTFNTSNDDDSDELELSLKAHNSSTPSGKTNLLLSSTSFSSSASSNKLVKALLGK